MPEEQSMMTLKLGVTYQVNIALLYNGADISFHSEEIQKKKTKKKTINCL